MFCKNIQGVIYARLTTENTSLPRTMADHCVLPLNTYPVAAPQHVLYARLQTGYMRRSCGIEGCYWHWETGEVFDYGVP